MITFLIINILTQEQQYIHTAIPLSKKMFQNKMSSALGLSIGWGALIQDTHLKTFSDLFTKDESILPGITKFLNTDKSIMCLVTTKSKTS